MTERAYCRVYYSVKDDPKFEGIWGNDHHLAAWLRLLMAADAIWPASADLPARERRSSVKALADAGLVDLLPRGMYRIHGLDAERGARRESARASVAQRTSYGRRTNVHTNVSQPGYSRSEPSQAEPSQAEPTPARHNGMERAGVVLPYVVATPPPPDAYGISEDEARVFGFLARHGAAIRAESGFGRRILGLIERRGVEDVLRQAGVMARGERLSDRQWVFGLEEALEAVPNGRDAQKAERAEDERRLRENRLAATAAQTAELRATLAAKGQP